MLREDTVAKTDRREETERTRAQRHYEYMADLMGGETDSGRAWES